MEPSSLDDYVQLIQMSNKKFEADRDIREVQSNVKVIKAGETGALSSILQKEHQAVMNPKYLPLKIPRRPAWNNQMTAHEIKT